MRAVLLTAAFVAVLACGGRSQSPEVAPASEPPAAAEVQVVERVEALAGAVDSAGCDAYAAEVDAWLADDAAEVASLARQSRESPALDAAALEAIDARLTAAFEIVIRAAGRCTDHPGATAAYQSFERFIAAS